jgi:phospholipase C
VAGELTRRDALAGLGALLGVVATAGCGSDAGADGDGGMDATRIDAFEAADASPPDADPLAHCTSESSLSASELLAGIDTFVVLMMENRSFDHYFGAMSLVEGRADIDGLTGGETNLDESGNPVGVHVLDDYTPADPPHGWGACHNQWNEGANDGFVTEHAGNNETDAMGYYLREHLPQLYALADGGAVCDKFFCSVLGPTWPNRYYLHGATSNGQQGNFPITGYTNIFDVLDQAGVSNVNYFSDVAWATGAYAKLGGLERIDNYFDAAAAGELPEFVLIDPSFFGGGANDDHPSHDIRLGQALISSVFNALAQSPQWDRSLFLVTYDEHGGFYDHVAPPPVIDDDADFLNLGFRVPTVVAGPTVRRGCAVSTPMEHVSILSTLRTRFGIDALNDRMAVTYDVSSCIDPALVNDPQPPPLLPELEISREAIRQRPDVMVHQEMADAIGRLDVPRHLDLRHEGMHATERWLERAADVGAVKLID